MVTIFFLKDLTPNKLCMEGKVLNLIKGIHKKFTANIILNGKRLNAFLLRLGAWQKYFILMLLFNIALEVLSLMPMMIN